MKSFVKKYVLHNIWTKLFSILLAIVAWSMIMHSSDPYITVTIKNIQVSKNNETAVTDERKIYDVVSGETVNISVYGPRSVVQKLDEKDINAYVDMKELSITNACPIHVAFKDTDSTKNAKVTSKSSEVMILSLENMVTESKQVVCLVEGTSPSGYYAVASVNPATIDVYGSENAVSNIERIAATVDITDKYATFVSEVPVVMQDYDGAAINSSSITMQTEKVEVTVNIYKTKNINVKVAADVSAMKGFSCGELRFAPDTITIAGPSEAINSITEITIPFSSKDVNETINENIMLAQYIPENCYRVSNTEFVSITIPVELMDEDRKFELKLSELAVEGLPDELGIDNPDDTVTVRVWGVKGYTKDISVRDLALYADLSGAKEEGSYRATILNRSTKNLMFDDAVAVFELYDIEKRRAEEEAKKKQEENQNGNDNPNGNNNQTETNDNSLE